MLAARRCPFIVIRFAFPLFAPRRLASSPRLFVSGDGEMSSGEVGSGAFSCGIFARSNTLLVVLALPYMPWRWGHRMRGIRARLHKLHLFTGRREFLLLGAVNLLGTASPFSCYFFGSSLLASPFLVSIIVEMSGDLIDEDIFFFVGFLRDRVLFLPCVCYNLCRGDGDLRMGGIRASVSYATPPYAGGVVCFLLLSTRRPHSC